MIDSKMLFWFLFGSNIMMIFVVAASGISLLKVDQIESQMSTHFEGWERYDMYNLSLAPRSLLNGIYDSTGFYCVWTKGRDTVDILDDDPSLQLVKTKIIDKDNTINETALHEFFHYYLDTYENDKTSDFYHFCENHIG